MRTEDSDLTVPNCPALYASLHGRRTRLALRGRSRAAPRHAPSCLNRPRRAEPCAVAEYKTNIPDSANPALAMQTAGPRGAPTSEKGRRRPHEKQGRE